MCVSLYVYVYHTHVCRDLKRRSDPLGLDLQVFVSRLTCVTGTEPGPLEEQQTQALSISLVLLLPPGDPLPPAIELVSTGICAPQIAIR